MFFHTVFFSSPGSITQNLRYGYAEMAEADTSLGILILVNKHHKLAEGYRPHDLVPVYPNLCLLLREFVKSFLRSFALFSLIEFDGGLSTFGLVESSSSSDVFR